MFLLAISGEHMTRYRNR